MTRTLRWCSNALFGSMALPHLPMVFRHSSTVE
jgi:hypothetical protein